jgi:hypothetical protein
MKLFATCPSCTIDIWGWQRTCSACEAASSARPAESPETLFPAASTVSPSRLGQIVAGLAVAVGRVVPNHPRTP